MINELNLVVHKWLEIGIQLGIKFHVLKTFELQHNKDPRRCLSEMLQYWLDGKACEKSHVSWETIIEVLDSPSINEATFARRLRENIQLQYGTSEYGSGCTSTLGAGQLQLKVSPGTFLLHYCFIGTITLP